MWRRHLPPLHPAHHRGLSLPCHTFLPSVFLPFLKQLRHQYLKVLAAEAISCFCVLHVRGVVAQEESKINYHQCSSDTLDATSATRMPGEVNLSPSASKDRSLNHTRKGPRQVQLQNKPPTRRICFLWANRWIRWCECHARVSRFCVG